MSFVHHFFSCPQGRQTISQVLSCALWTLEPTRWMCQWSAATGGCWVRWLLEGLASCCSLVVPLWIFMAAWCQGWSWHQINCSLDGEFLETLAMGWDGGFTWILMGSRVQFAHVYRVFKGSYRTSPKIGMISSMIPTFFVTGSRQLLFPSLSTAVLSVGCFGVLLILLFVQARRGSPSPELTYTPDILF